MRKPIYIPSIESYNKRQAEIEEMRTFREQLRILGLTVAVFVVGVVMLAI